MKTYHIATSILLLGLLGTSAVTDKSGLSYFAEIHNDQVDENINLQNVKNINKDYILNFDFLSRSTFGILSVAHAGLEIEEEVLQGERPLLNVFLSGTNTDAGYVIKLRKSFIYKIEESLKEDPFWFSYRVITFEQWQTTQN